MQYICTSARRFEGCRSKNINISVLICEPCVSCDFRQLINETASSHFGSQFSSSQVRGSQFTDYKHSHKMVYGKKVSRFKRRRVETCIISKDFAHLMIRKIDEGCFNIFLTQVSAFGYLIVIYNSLFYISFQVLWHIAFRRMQASMLGFLICNSYQTTHWTCTQTHTTHLFCSPTTLQINWTI